MELGAADIDSEDRDRAMLEEAIGEPSCGRAEVQAGEPGDIDGEVGEGVFELEAAATDVLFAFDELDRCLGVEEGGGFDEGLSADAGTAGHDQAAGALAGIGETTLNEEDIGSDTRHGGIVDFRLAIVDWISRASSPWPHDRRRLASVGISPQERVQAALEELGLESRVVTFERSTATAQEAADACGCELGQIVKTLCFVADGRPTIVLAAGDRQVDTAAVASLVGVGRKKLKMATPEQVRESTGYEVGGVSPVALAGACDIVVDQSLQRFDDVWVAAGAGNAVFPAKTAKLVERVSGQWAQITRTS